MASDNSASPMVDLSRRGRIGLILIDNPPVNALARPVRTGIEEGIKRYGADPEVAAVVIACRGRTFIAGADISEFGKPFTPPLLWDLVDEIEACPKPVVAALHGTVLGGGLEIALACHYRIASSGASFGFPEVKLGILPAAGGTQRLPRVVGLPMALDMIVSGRPIKAKAAAAAGLVDKLTDDADPLAAALAWAETLAQEGKGPRPVSKLAVSAEGGEAAIEKARKDAQRHPSGPVAARACVDALAAALKLPYREGQKRELELFYECYNSPYAPALWHVFFAERASANVPGVSAEIASLPVAKVAVIGLGQMGRGIANVFLDADFAVTGIESTAQTLATGGDALRATYAGQVAKGRLTQEAADRRLSRLTLADKPEAAADADVVIEAAVESMEIKKTIFRNLDRIAKAGAILATNTSSLDLDEIAKVTSRPQSVVGLHFFNPVPVMRLLEVVRGAATGPGVLATVLRLARKINKVPVVAGVCYGFIGNRMLDAYLTEANALLLEGATPAGVDKALQNWGLAMGPFAMSDLSGLDVLLKIRDEAQMPPERRKLFGVGDALARSGKYGQKTGAGFFLYPEGSRRPTTDAAVEELGRKLGGEVGIAARQVSDEEIVERCLFQLVNEGAKILEERIALRAGDIDTVYVNGYGFPAWRGGPMWSADQIGLKSLVTKMRAFAERHGARWTPAPLLVRLAEANKTFSQESFEP